MKKSILIPILLVMAVILVSCGIPEDPKDFQPYCEEQYNIMLASYPDYPRAFIGACVSALHTDKPNAFVALCRYEPFRDSLEIGTITQQECIQYIHSMP